MRTERENSVDEELSTKPEVPYLVDRLSVLSSSIYAFHDGLDFEGLVKSSYLLLSSMGVCQRGAEEGSRMVSEMYRLSDEADSLLMRGDKAGHDAVFSKIFEEALKLDLVLGLKKGSIADEVRWWYFFRLAFDKNRNWLVRRYYLLAAYFAAVQEHYRRLGSLRYGVLCATHLGRAGLAHKARDVEKERRLLRQYWRAKIKGNGFRVEPELFSI